MICEEGKVPGWLDENGNPQGCVDNNPTPGVPKEVPESAVHESVTVQAATAQPTELAITGGFELVGLALLSALLMTTGTIMMKRAKKEGFA